MSNQRRDEYGGSTENRVRLLVEVSKAIRAAVGHDFTVSIRISQAKVNDFSYQWADKEQAAAVIFEQLGQADVVALGKAALANYDWVNKVAAGKG